MVVGAMLLSGSSAGLGIPKSPSFHSSLELAAATKDLNIQNMSNKDATMQDQQASDNKQVYIHFLYKQIILCTHTNIILNSP